MVKCNTDYSKHYSLIDQDTFWRYFVKYWKDQIIATAISPENVNDFQNIKQTLGKHRFTAINSCTNFEANEIIQLFNEATKSLLSNINLGTLSCIDESIISYFGLLSYQICQRLNQTGIPLSLAVSPRVPNNLESAKEAAISLMSHLYEIDQTSQHIIFDSGFHILSLKDEVKQFGYKFTASFKHTGVQPPNKIVHLSQKLLKTGQSFRFQNQDEAIEVHRSPMYVNGTITNAYLFNAPQNTITNTKISYKMAQFMCFQQTKSEIIRVFGITNNQAAGKSEVELIKEFGGIDLTLPPPDSNGKPEWNKEVIEILSLPHLKIKYKSLPNLGYISTMSKTKILNEIIDHPIVKAKIIQYTGKAPEVTNKPLSLLQAKSVRLAFTGEPNQGESLHDFHLYSYNLVDILDKNFYGSVKESKARAWGKSFFSTLLFLLTHNAYALHREYHYKPKMGQKDEETNEDRKNSFNSFLLSLLRDISSKYPILNH
eukprot:gene3565-4442_t